MITLLLAGMCLQETKAERLTAWVVETKVKGKLTATFSNQDYPFEYEGWTTLTAAEIDELRKDGKVGEELAKRIALAFAEPEPVKKSDKKDPKAEDPKTADKIAAVELTVKETETVRIPLWASLGAVGAGVVLLALGFRQR